MTGQTISVVQIGKRHVSSTPNFAKAVISCSIAIFTLISSTAQSEILASSTASMSVVSPGAVTDLTRVEARVSIRNPGVSSQSYELNLYRKSSLGTEIITSANVTVPAGEQILYSQWIPMGGHAGVNTVKYKVTPNNGPQLHGETSFQVAASKARATPIISTAWIDPGAILPGIYPQNRSVTQMDLRDSIDAAYEVGVETLVITYSEYILNGWGAFYPSQKFGSLASFDVVGTILDQASINGQKVFVGLGRGNDLMLTWDGFDDPDRIAAGLDHGKQIATELWDLYSQESSFFGWYLTHEANDIQRASEAYYNPMADFLREIEADKPVMVSPSGTPIISPTILADSHVDIFTYQDAVGAGYVPYVYTFDPQQRINMLEEVFTSYRNAHHGVNKHLWANLEAWEMAGPSYGNAYPAEFNRLLQQLEIEKNYADTISSYEWLGFFEHPESTVQLGGQKAVDLYTDYRSYYQQIARNLKVFNYIDNPGFEQGLTPGNGHPLDWTFSGNGIDQIISLSIDGASGSESSVSLYVDSNVGESWISQDIPVMAGTEYKFSAWGKELLGDPSGGWLAAEVWMLADENSVTILEDTSLFFTSSDWELQEAFITVPLGATVARVIFNIQDSVFGVGTGHYLIDGVSLTGPELPFLPGDFNGDFVVDDADLLQWETGFGEKGKLGSQDFLLWQQYFGASLQPGTKIFIIPEPTTWTMALFGIFLLGNATRYCKK